MGSRARCISGTISIRATSRRSVTIGTASVTSGTLSCCSWGSSWRNQPTQPETARIAPSVLTMPLVSRPAKSSATPKARTTGHAVGAGNSTLAGVLVPFGFTSGSIAKSLSLADCPQFRFSFPDDIHHGEYDHPHDVHKMPIERQHIDAMRLLVFH